MSYARIDENSDVYVFGSVSGGFNCCGCSLKNSSDYSFACSTRKELLDHLKEHIRILDKVPQHAIDRITDEMHKEGQENQPVPKDKWDDELPERYSEIRL